MYIMDLVKNHPHWSAVQGIIDVLSQNGYVAWLAGGCVRDFLLKVQPKDFDIVTDAKPDIVLGLFPNGLDVGKQFGVIIVPFDGFQIEIATFRSDGEYLDGRHPSRIVFSTPKEDAERRDFTINALFYDPVADRIHDFVNGKQDLSKQLLRAVGDPEKRFSEDKLRMLRAVRFATQLNFQIDPPTMAAIKKYKNTLHQVSVERIQNEINKILEMNRRAMGFELLKELGLLTEIFGALPIATNWGKTLKLLEHAGDLATQWAYLFFYSFNELGPRSEELHTFFRKFKFSNQLETEVFGLLKFYDFMLEISKVRRGIALGHLYTSYTERGLELYKTIQQLENKDLGSYSYAVGLKKEWIQLPKPILTGEHLIRLKIEPGPKYKELLQEAYYLQLEKKLRDINQALDWAKAQKT